MDSLENHHPDEEACVNAMLFSLSGVLPRFLHTAIELDLFRIIAKGGPGAYVSASEISSQLPTKNPDAPSLLDRILYLFVTHSLLSYAPRTLQDEKPETSKASQYASSLDTVMITQPSGKGRTAREFEALTSAAGFTHFHVACIAHDVWVVMESYKL